MRQPKLKTKSLSDCPNLADSPSAGNTCRAQWPAITWTASAWLATDSRYAETRNFRAAIAGVLSATLIEDTRLL